MDVDFISLDSIQAHTLLKTWNEAVDNDACPEERRIFERDDD